jgi:stearoyl-CoA desaturase (delta-9 desaturase)
VNEVAAFTDEFGLDHPHSPHLHGEGVRGLLQGLWHAHLGWLFQPDTPDRDRYIPDLLRDPLVVRVSNLFGLWVALGALIPAVLGGLLTMTWIGALLGFLWGGAVRVFLVHHATFSINSVCHLWGSRPFRSHDHSRNNFLFGVLAMGEGWHNNHHVFPASARHGLRWWEIDISYWVIRCLGWLGLAWDIRTPSGESLAAKRRGYGGPFSDESSDAHAAG